MFSLTFSYNNKYFFSLIKILIQNNMAQLFPHLWLWLALFYFIQLPFVNSYFIHVDANEEQCFFDRVTSGTKMGLMFEVAEGDF